MTADEFLRDLALRVEVIREYHEHPYDVDGMVGVDRWAEPTLVVRLDPYDAEEFLNLTGVRVE